MDMENMSAADLSPVFLVFVGVVKILFSLFSFVENFDADAENHYDAGNDCKVNAKADLAIDDFCGGVHSFINSKTQDEANSGRNKIYCDWDFFDKKK